MNLVDEAGQLLVESLLISLRDEDDDKIIPVRELVVHVGDECGVDSDSYDSRLLPEWESVGWMRAKMRDALAGLAS